MAMVDEARPQMFRNSGSRSVRPDVPSRAASLATLGCVAAIGLGVLAQFLLKDAIVWEMITALGLASLASIVFAHQR